MEQTASHWLEQRRVTFIGKLGGVTRREAARLVRHHGGQVLERDDPHIDTIVIGADELPLSGPDELLTNQQRAAAAAGDLQVVTETQFWEQLGLVDTEQSIQRLYTPRMLAELLDVPVSIIRRWHRRGLIIPAREVHRLPYFDFQEVATARQLARLLAAGASPAAIEKKLAELVRFVPEVERPLSQLPVIVEGKNLLLRQGEGLIEPSGQKLIDFSALEDPAPDDACQPTISLHQAISRPTGSAVDRSDEGAPSIDELKSLAMQAEDAGRLAEAGELLRAALAAGGPDPVLCFQLAELLYRQGDLTAARERYFMAIELDEDYVEARANLGCVLAETGQPQLAIAAFQGALLFHQDYPDVHYHLARTLDEVGQANEAERHWQRFLELAPDSPWADEARARLQDRMND